MFSVMFTCNFQPDLKFRVSESSEMRFWPTCRDLSSMTTFSFKLKQVTTVNHYKFFPPQTALTSCWTYIMETYNPEKINGTELKIKQKWNGLKSFDICISIIFRCFDQSLSSRKDRALGSNFQISLIFPSLLRS